MFNSLVECAKTKKDNKRWAYFAVTSTIWTLALAGSIVGGIFLYDAKLDEQLSVLAMLVNPPPPPPPPPPANTVSKAQPSNQAATSDIPTRTKLENIEPATDIKTRASSPSLVKVSTGFGVDGGVDGGVNGGQLNGVLDGVIGSTGSADAPPPPKPDPAVAEPEVEKPKPSIIRKSEGVLKGNTIFQGKPDYPAIARNAGITGEVKVEILINEEGNVVGTKVISGHPMLQPAALGAAKQWRFNPTLLNGTPVKVQGVLTFRFSL